MTFGEHLRDERNKKALTVESLAALCGVSRSYLTLIENNKRNPSKKILAKVSSALKIKNSTVLNWYLEDLRKKLS